jgi:hypothetical protein
MEHSSSREADLFSASEEIPRILLNLKVPYCFHKSPPFSHVSLTFYIYRHEQERRQNQLLKSRKISNIAQYYGNITMLCYYIAQYHNVVLLHCTIPQCCSITLHNITMLCYYIAQYRNVVLLHRTISQCCTVILHNITMLCCYIAQYHNVVLLHRTISQCCAVTLHNITMLCYYIAQYHNVVLLHCTISQCCAITSHNITMLCCYRTGRAR